MENATARVWGSPTFSRGHRMRRALFQLAWLLLARWTPRPFHRWRRLVLIAFGARLAPSAKVYSSARIWYPPNLEMDTEAALASGVDCYCMAPIRIGAYSTVSQDAFLCGGTHDVHRPGLPLVTRPITIGPRAWIAARAFVGPGVTVGEGAVLGACAVAARDLAPWTIHTGNPAVEVRRRSPDAGDVKG